MHITLEEALSLLDAWKYRQTLLEIRLPGSRAGVRIRGTIWARVANQLTVRSEANESVEINLDGVTGLNGDARTASDASGKDAYLVCEFGENDPVEFRAIERRSAQRIPLDMPNNSPDEPPE